MLFSSDATRHFLGRDPFRKIGEIGFFQFHDYLAKMIWQPGTKSKIALTGFNIHDEEKDSKTIFSDKTTKDQRLIKNYGWGLNLSHLWNSKHQTRMSATHSNFENQFNSDIRYSFNVAGLPDTRELNNQIHETQLNLTHFWNQSSKTFWRFGAGYKKRRIYHQDNVFIPVIDYHGVDVDDMLWRDQTIETTHFSTVMTNRLMPSLKSTLGLRLLFDNNQKLMIPENRQWFAEPEISLQKFFTSGISGDISWNQRYQTLHQLNSTDYTQLPFNLWWNASTDFQPALSQNLEISLNWKTNPICLSVTLFNSRREGLQYFSPNRFGYRSASSFNNLERYNSETSGLELTAIKQSGSWTGWLSYELSKTMWKLSGFTTSDPFPADFDRRHTLKGLINFKLGQWDFSLTGIYASGRPVTPIDRVYSMYFYGTYPRAYFTEGPVNSVRTPDYARLDLHISRSWKLKNGLRGRLGLNWMQLLGRYGRSNVWYYSPYNHQPGYVGKISGSRQILMNNRFMQNSSIQAFFEIKL